MVVVDLDAAAGAVLDGPKRYVDHAGNIGAGRAPAGPRGAPVVADRRALALRPALPRPAVAAGPGAREADLQPGAGLPYSRHQPQRTAAPAGFPAAAGGNPGQRRHQIRPRRGEPVALAREGTQLLQGRAHGDQTGPQPQSAAANCSIADRPARASSSRGSSTARNPGRSQYTVAARTPRTTPPATPHRQPPAAPRPPDLRPRTAVARRAPRVRHTERSIRRHRRDESRHAQT